MYIYKTVKINKYILGKVKDYGFTQICFLKWGAKDKLN